MYSFSALHSQYSSPLRHLPPLVLLELKVGQEIQAWGRNLFVRSVMGPKLWNGTHGGEDPNAAGSGKVLPEWRSNIFPSSSSSLVGLRSGFSAHLLVSTLTIQINIIVLLSCIISDRFVLPHSTKKRVGSAIVPIVCTVHTAPASLALHKYPRSAEAADYGEREGTGMGSRPMHAKALLRSRGALNLQSLLGGQNVRYFQKPPCIVFMEPL